MLNNHQLPIAIEKNIFSITIITLLAILYTPLIWHWYDGWLKIHKISIEHEYFSHGVIGLPLAAYIIWTAREKWNSLPDNSHYLGAILLGCGGIFYLSGQQDLVNISFPIIITALCLWLKGISGLKLLSFPLILIWLATPNQIPYLITPYTLPLQSFIAQTAGFILIKLGQPVKIDNIYLSINNNHVEVAPYCAGLKMLFTTLYVSLILLYWRDGVCRISTKTILFLSSAVVLSISGNIVRNTLLTFFHGNGKERSFETLHAGWAGDIYSVIILGLLIPILIGLEKLINHQQIVSKKSKNSY